MRWIRAAAAIGAALTMVSLGAHAAASVVGMEEIVITAQRIESPLSRTPMSVSAMTGQELQRAGIASTQQLGDYVPNLSIDQSSTLYFTLRGVTSNDATEKGDSSTAFMLDDIYVARPQAQDVSFYDLARVEVLRGPQGTLWGRNTTAGALNVISNRPVHEFAANLHATIGNFNARLADGMINVPISEGVALRGAFAYDRRDSYYLQGVQSAFTENRFRDNLSGRLQGLFEFSATAKLLLRGDYSRMQGSSASSGLRLSDIYDLSDPRYPVRRPGVNSNQLRTRSYVLGGSTRARDNTWGASAEFDWNLGAAALTYLGAYRQLNRDEGFPGNFGFGGVNGLFFGHYWQHSQELRVATSGDGALQAQAGAYYFKEKSKVAYWLKDLVPGYFAPYFGFPQDPTIAENYAGFGQLTYAVVSAVRLTAGLRYSHDSKSRVGATAHQQTLTYHPPPLPACTSAPLPFAGADCRLINDAAGSWSKTTWRTAVDVEVAPNQMLYASVASGYKAGGFGDGCAKGTIDASGLPCNQVVSNDDLYYQPETLTAYEMGFKMKAGGSLRFSGAAFYYDYKNMQLSAIGNVGGAPSLVTRNAGKAEVKGLEFEGSYLPTAHDRWDTAFTWLDAKYLQYIAAGVVNFRGRALDRSPEWTATLGYAHTWPLRTGGSVEASARTRHSDHFVVSVFSAPAQYDQPGFTKTDVALTYTAAADRWYIKAFARNLEDEAVLTTVDGSGNFNSGQPRTVGLSAGINF